MGRTKPTVSPDYIIGMTDGEGCFYVNLSQKSAYRSGVRVQLHFHIKLQATDKDLLAAIRDSLGCGNVYFQNEKRQNHTQCYRYTVSSQKDIFEKIIPFFQRYPLQTFSKRKSFNLFVEIAELIKDKTHLTKDGIDKIRVRKMQMNQRTHGLA